MKGYHVRAAAAATAGVMATVKIGCHATVNVAATAVMMVAAAMTVCHVMVMKAATAVVMVTAAMMTGVMLTVSFLIR